jgi:hypothetical protein
MTVDLKLIDRPDTEPNSCRPMFREAGDERASQFVAQGAAIARRYGRVEAEEFSSKEAALPAKPPARFRPARERRPRLERGRASRGGRGWLFPRGGTASIPREAK